MYLYSEMNVNRCHNFSPFGAWQGDNGCPGSLVLALAGPLEDGTEKRLRRARVEHRAEPAETVVRTGVERLACLRGAESPTVLHVAPVVCVCRASVWPRGAGVHLRVQLGQHCGARLQGVQLHVCVSGPNPGRPAPVSSTSAGVRYRDARYALWTVRSRV